MDENKLKKMLDASPDMYLVVDGDGTLIDFKPSRDFEPALPPEQFLGNSIKKVVPEGLAASALELIRQTLDTRKEGLLEYSFPVEGEPHFFEARFTVFERDQVLVLIRDVTGRRKSMQAAKAFMDASSDLFLLLDRHGYVITINKAAAASYQKTPEQMEGTVYWDHLAPEKAQVRKERLEKILESGEPAGFVDISDERIFEVTANPVKEPGGVIRYVAYSVREISGQVKNEQELMESEARYRSLFDENPVPMYIYDTSTLAILDANRSLIENYGYSKDELSSMKISDIRPPEDLSRVMENVTDLRSKQVYLGLWRHTKKDGSVIDVEITSGDFPFMDRPARLVLCNDVTARVKVEKDLAASEDKFRTVFMTSPISMSIHRGRDGFTVDVNEAFLEQTGFERDDVIGKTVFEYGVWEDTSHRDQFVQELLTKGSVEGVEARFRVKDGSIRHGLVSARLIEFGEEKYHISIVKDITDLKNIENALMQSEQKFRSVVESSPMGIHMYRLDKDDRLIFIGANPAADHILGLDHTRFEGLPLEEAFPGASDTEISDRYREVCLSGDPWHSEQIDYQDNDIKGAFEVHAFQTGHRSMSVMFLEITEKKKVLAAIAESEEKFRTAFITSPDSVNINRLESGEYIDINEGFSQIMGYTREEVLGRTSLELDIWADPDERERLVRDLQRDGYVNNFESRFRTKNGTVRHGLMSAKIFNLKGEPHILSITRDITEKKDTEAALIKSEEQLRASLWEKEILLKEIHHRVKNNLQVISGLLDLQAHHITDPMGREIYKESQNRVITMALIHEELYKSINLSQVDFADYIDNLCHNLMVSYGVDRKRIKLDIITEETDMVVDTAIPCGLIVNELITNALKHAFPGKRKGTISLSFRQQKNKYYLLTVSDDGVGMPRGVDISRTPTLGMQLITVLVGQLGGTLKVKRKEGTTFTIKFKEYHEAGSVLY